MNEINENLSPIPEEPFDLTVAKRSYSRIGLSLLTIFLVGTILQLLMAAIPPIIWGEDNFLTASSWGLWIITFVPIYVVAFPLCLLMLRKLPASTPAPHKIGAKRFLGYIPLCFFLMYAGNIIGIGLSSFFSGGTAENAILEYAMDDNPIKILVMVILAPIFEELVFRKQLIDRCVVFGEKWAVIFSGVCFGLFHGNLFQFFYAFFLGCIFAYIYIRSGKMRYSAILHMLINFIGGVAAPWFISMIDLEALATLDPIGAPEAAMEIIMENAMGLALYMLFMLFIMVMFFWGLALFINKIKKTRWEAVPYPLPKGTVFKTAYLNAGVILFALSCIIVTVLMLFL
ncbi:MAG: CPBP family intramembrane metalloprotease [Oscillospiraceae bacterium]|nr:CPBP family intramembrane metalloprotease [Oscillospiraceae bacterium]